MVVLVAVEDSVPGAVRPSRSFRLVDVVSRSYCLVGPRGNLLSLLLLVVVSLSGNSTEEETLRLARHY